MGTQPVWGHDSQGIERRAQRLAHSLQSVQRTNCGQHVRRVGALPPPPFEQPTTLDPLQEAFQQYRFRPTGDQPSPEFTQDAVVEARIVDLQPKQILPIDAAANRLSRLPIRKTLGELQDGNQR